MQEEQIPPSGDFDSVLTQAELDEARLLQQLHENGQAQLSSPHTVDPEASVADLSYHVNADESEAIRNSPEAAPDALDTTPASPMSQAPVTPLEAESPKSDKGSLLSEDPEDEDAEPDWLL